MVPELGVQGLRTVAPSLGGPGSPQGAHGLVGRTIQPRVFQTSKQGLAPQPATWQPRLSPSSCAALTHSTPSLTGFIQLLRCAKLHPPLPTWSLQMNAVPSAWNALAPVPPPAASFSTARFHLVITCSENSCPLSLFSPVLCSPDSLSLISAVPLTGCVTLGKLLALSEAVSLSVTCSLDLDLSSAWQG